MLVILLCWDIWTIGLRMGYRNRVGVWLHIGDWIGMVWSAWANARLIIYDMVVLSLHLWLYGSLRRRWTHSRAEVFIYVVRFVVVIVSCSVLRCWFFVDIVWSAAQGTINDSFRYEILTFGKPLHELNCRLASVLPPSPSIFVFFSAFCLYFSLYLSRCPC